MTSLCTVLWRIGRSVPPTLPPRIPLPLSCLAETCKGGRPGSFGNYELDATTLAGWGVDMVKMDHCGAKNGTDQQLYGNMSRALNATGQGAMVSNMIFRTRLLPSQTNWRPAAPSARPPQR